MPIYRQCKTWRRRIANQTEAGGHWIRDFTPENSTVFVTALETGYFSKRRTIDSPGLVSPQVFAFLKENRTNGILEVADHFKADYAFILDSGREPVPPTYEYVRSFAEADADKFMQIGATRYSLYRRIVAK